MKKKRKATKKKKTARSLQVNVKASQGKEDVKQRRKYNRGGRIEAYTYGETQGKKKDKVWG